MSNMSARAEAIYRRTYSRTKSDGTKETFKETIDRVIEHQRWIWERTKQSALDTNEQQELETLRHILQSRRGLLAGRTLWLGGTEISKRREASQFNCSFLRIETIDDVVDAFWLLLQGCGVGFRAVPGTLSGFSTKIPKLTVVRSSRRSKGGRETNREEYRDGVWTISVGDSAEAWAKSIGKILCSKHVGCKELVLDFSEIRPAGEVLSGYGWISAGDGPLSTAYSKVFDIMNRHEDDLLDHEAIHDIINLLGTVLSSRRSAQISLYHYGMPGWKEFAQYKNDLENTPWRSQSNNSLVFYSKPSREEIREVLDIMVKSGGSEPGMINAATASIRAPWFSGVNPCAEILLSNKGFCNLCEYNIGGLGTEDVMKATNEIMVLARANYRQTCVNLNDGILQKAWDQNNKFLRLCGVSITGIASSYMTNNDLELLRNWAEVGAYSMASSLNLPLPKNVTTVKPSGTISKIMDTTEGMHAPVGKYVFNNINFGNNDPFLRVLKDSGYRTFPNPYDPTGTLVTFPVFNDCPDYGIESAVSQLNRYKNLMNVWCDQNVSCTISYSPDEIQEIEDWLVENWDSYVGVSFILRSNPNLSAADIGYAYLPQEVVSKEVFEKYVKELSDLNADNVISTSDLENDCVGGSCPIR